MISYDQYCKIKSLSKEDGLSVMQIAQACGLSWSIVDKWLREPNYQKRKSGVRTSKLDPYKDYIQSLLEKHDYSGIQILQKVKEAGYAGGYSILKAYVHKVRPARRQAFLTLNFAPGECAQVDWGNFGSVQVGSTRRKLSFFLMVLCHSRMLYLEFTVLQTMEHFLSCHEHAFEFFGGVPSKIMVDNLKSAVLQRLTGEAPVFNQRYLDFARHYGFTISPCAPRRGNEKGRVENGVGYVKKNFLRGLEISDFSTLRPEARLWMDQIANVRIHGETKKRPCDVFASEKLTLKPLSKHPYDLGTVFTVRASSRFRVTFDTNRYSVPAKYASARLTLKAYPDRLCIYAWENLVATHPRSYDRHQDFEHPDHPKELLLQRHKAREQKLYSSFLSICSRAADYYTQLENKGFNTRHHIRKIMALYEIYGKELVARAIEDAFVFNAFSSDYIANILQQRSRVLPQAAALTLTRRQDLLEIELPQPDLNIYETRTGDANAKKIKK